MDMNYTWYFSAINLKLCLFVYIAYVVSMVVIWMIYGFFHYRFKIQLHCAVGELREANLLTGLQKHMNTFVQMLLFPHKERNVMVIHKELNINKHHNRFIGYSLP